MVRCGRGNNIRKDVSDWIHVTREETSGKFCWHVTEQFEDFPVVRGPVERRRMKVHPQPPRHFNPEDRHTVFCRKLLRSCQTTRYSGSGDYVPSSNEYSVTNRRPRPLMSGGWNVESSHVQQLLCTSRVAVVHICMYLRTTAQILQKSRSHFKVIGDRRMTTTYIERINKY